MPNEKIRSYKDLDVWKLAMDVAEQSYRLTKPWPREEQFGLTAQIRRAAAAVPANITEGYGRETTAYSIQFLRISQGSQKELETHLLLATRVDLVAQTASQTLLDANDLVGKMLRNLIRSLQAKER